MFFCYCLPFLLRRSRGLILLCLGISCNIFNHVAGTFGMVQSPTSREHSFKSVPNCSKGFIFDGTKIETSGRSVRSELECSRLCTKLANCVAYNIMNESRPGGIVDMTCEFLSVSAATCGSLTVKPNSVFKYCKYIHI